MCSNSARDHLTALKPLLHLGTKPCTCPSGALTGLALGPYQLRQPVLVLGNSNAGGLGVWLGPCGGVGSFSTLQRAPSLPLGLVVPDPRSRLLTFLASFPSSLLLGCYWHPQSVPQFLPPLMKGTSLQKSSRGGFSRPPGASLRCIFGFFSPHVFSSR